MPYEICIAGKNQIAVEAGIYLKKEFPELDLVVLPNRTDNGRDTWQPSLKKWATHVGIPIIRLQQCYGISNLLFISLEFDRIIDPSKFVSSRLFNIHFSLLPKYKGMYTSIHPLLRGEENSGVTLHRIDAGIDTGEIIEQIEFPIPISMNARKLYDQYMENGLTLFKRNFRKLLQEEETSIKQPSVASTYFPMSSINFSAIEPNFRQTAFQFHNWIRGFVFREYQLPVVYESAICRSEILSTTSSQAPGTIVHQTKQSFTISTIDFDVMLWKDPVTLFQRFLTGGKQLEALDLLKSIVNFEQKTVEGWTPLMIAAFHANVRLVEVLLEMGADFLASNDKGTTVLMYAYSGASKTNDPKALKLICSMGPNFDAVDDQGKTVFCYAKENGDFELKKLIERFREEL